MSFFSKIRGTVESLFQIGKGGPQLKNNAGAVEVRNAGDAAFVIARALDPVAVNDLVTLGYFNAHNEGAAGLEVVKMPLAHATKVSTASIPDNSIIQFAIIDVTTIYDGASPTFTVKRTGDATVVPIDTGDSDLTAVGTYQVPEVKSWGSTGAGTVTATFAGAGNTVGAGILYIGYTTPLDIS
jgi:hypothetical protein